MNTRRPLPDIEGAGDQACREAPADKDLRCFLRVPRIDNPLMSDPAARSGTIFS
ncbi:hypothetical protein REMIM1_PB00166 (plasmid) [Rhizobium etli bv. mimosae str. Mim1]|nr:hypothetical protein REMIM1_PB00166 [Rhizobium etli bv. mimosae str. Mim1]